ncbi:MAG: rRNA-specific endonuclease VapC20 [Planctomycetota bacterium]|nr:rRNA-specific endonuclease VapC20 [Planctomycetota bacterium]
MLDTVGLIALWDEADQWHVAATRVYEQLGLGRTQLWTTTFILAECGNAAARRPYRGAVSRLLDQLTVSDRLVTPTDEDWDAAWSAYRRGDAGSAGIVDQISFAVMRRLGVTRAFTNDNHFRAAGMEPLF